MIIADPFGSWVQGAREGTQDAIALRQAQDATAANAYGLQTASQADPLRLQLLQNQARLSGLNANTAQQISDAGLPLQNARTASQTAQAALGSHLADYGDPRYLQQFSSGIVPGTQVGTHAGTQYISSPITDAQGHTINTAYPVANIESPHRINARMQAQHYNNQQDFNAMRQLQLREYQAAEQKRKMLGKPGNHGYNLLGKPINLNPNSANLPDYNPYTAGSSYIPPSTSKESSSENNPAEEPDTYNFSEDF